MYEIGIMYMYICITYEKNKYTNNKKDIHTVYNIEVVYIYIYIIFILVNISVIV